jgi:hypothetical protein
MASTSALLNRSLRAHVTPVLREAGFEKVEARSARRWEQKAVLVFDIRAVGNHFSMVTGWPPGSIGVWLAAYYPFAATFPVESDEDGRPLPAEYEGHMRSHLDCGLDQSTRLRPLANRAERARRDIWWVEPDGCNADEVARDVAAALGEHGLPWFAQVSDLQTAISMVEAERDCLMKFQRAAALAREIGDRQRLQKYLNLAEAESQRLELLGR